MLKATGLGTYHTDAGGISECDSFTCGHCQRVVFVQPGKSAYDIGGGCRICDSMVCSKCVDVGSCTPWEKSMEKMEARDAARRSYGI